MIKVLKESISNENNDISVADIDNVLEILAAKTKNAGISLTKYIDSAF